MSGNSGCNRLSRAVFLTLTMSLMGAAMGFFIVYGGASVVCSKEIADCTPADVAVHNPIAHGVEAFFAVVMGVMGCVIGMRKNREEASNDEDETSGLLSRSARIYTTGCENINFC